MKKALFSIICILICCLLSSAAVSEPRIEFTRIPFTDEGGSSRLDIIQGRVLAAKEGQKVVLFARSGDWYIQPFTEVPFTDIRADQSWSNITHLGTDYAALLVDADYVPPMISPVLPSLGGGVAAISVTPGSPFFWQTRWFQGLILLALLLVLIELYRRRVSYLQRQANIRFEERLAERTRIAHELHDTLLQGFLSASLQLHVAVEHLPKDAPERPQLLHIQELIGKVLAEGRDAVNDLRSNISGALDPAVEFSNIKRDLDMGSEVDFRVIVEGRPQ